MCGLLRMVQWGAFGSLFSRERIGSKSQVGSHFVSQLPGFPFHPFFMLYHLSESKIM